VSPAHARGGGRGKASPSSGAGLGRQFAWRIRRRQKRRAERLLAGLAWHAETHEKCAFDHACEGRFDAAESHLQGAAAIRRDMDEVARREVLREVADIVERRVRS